LTQTQLEFMFHAKEQRKKMRREGSKSAGSSNPGKVTKNTTHIT